jgi:hypothetical protein
LAKIIVYRALVYYLCQNRDRMPRGSNPGERRGGRPKGGKNKATLERAVIAERIMNETQMAGRKLGKEVLEEFMNLYSGIAAAFQPNSAADLEAWSNSPKEAKFEKYSKLAMKAAHDLAEYQTPKFAPVHVAAPPPSSKGPTVKKFTISIFDHQGRPAPRHIAVNSARNIVPSADTAPAPDFEPNARNASLKSK